MSKKTLTTDPLESIDIAAVRAALLRYFDRDRRDLPWRMTDDPYQIWVSEVMLQQTRVETVVPYYRAWMEAFPTLADLAAASEDRVLKQWQGLGYYSRARNLHRAARIVRERLGGVVPRTVEALRILPGVGPYTAGAVASIAHGQAVPAVDGNVRRVLARFLDHPSPSAGQLEGWAGRLVDPVRPGDFNQALMELGSQVCTPRTPTCATCPVATWCRALAAGTVAERPAPRRRPDVPHEHRAVLVLAHHHGGRWWVQVERRPDTGLLARMWAFPDALLTPPTAVTPTRAATQLAAQLAAQRGQTPDLAAGLELPAVDHRFSHRSVTYHPVLHIANEVPAHPQNGDPLHGVHWHPIIGDEDDEVALPVAQQKILAAAREALRAPELRRDVSPRTD